MNRKALSIIILIAVLILCACAKGADTAPSEGLFDETAPGESYDLTGRMEAWYASAGVTGEGLKKGDIEYVYDGKSEEERGYLDGFQLTRFSNGDILGVVSAHNEHPANDEQLRDELAQTLARREDSDYEIVGGDVYWTVIVSKDISIAHQYYENSANGIAP